MGIHQTRTAPIRELRLDAMLGGPGACQIHVMARINRGDDVKQIARDLSSKYHMDVSWRSLFRWVRRWKGVGK